MRPAIQRLEELSRDDAPRVGTKAANLADLLRAGFPVPRGVVLTPDAFGPTGGLTAEAERALVAELAAFGDGPLAVRSSGVAEDRPEASFAGQYETVLDVRGMSAVLDAVRRCRKSAQASRVGEYAATRGEHGGELAVLIQTLVPADTAGVAFTAHPVTGARDAVVVTAVRGLGERLVSGRATPDECTVTDAGVVCRFVESAIDERGAAAVARLARRVEQHFGLPQDIEWASVGEALYLLQARPMTALPRPIEWRAPLPGAWLRHFRLGEWLGDPVTPLFESWLLSRLEDRLHEHYQRWTGIRMPRPYHVVVNGWYFYGFSMPTNPRAMLGMLAQMLPRLLVRPRRVAMLIPQTARFGVELFVREWRTELLPRYLALTESLAAEVEGRSAKALVDLIDELSDAAGDYFTSVTAVAGFASKSELPLALFYRTHLHGRIAGSHMQLLGGLTTTPLQYDHAVQTLDWFQPTLGELAFQRDPTQGDERRVQQAKERTQAERRCRDALSADARLLRRFDKVLAVAQRFAALREEQIFSFTRPWPIMRRALRRIGGILRERGSVGDADDVFFLTRDELAAALAGGRTSRHDLAARRTSWQSQRRLAPPLVLGQLPPMMQRILTTLEESLRSPGPVDREAIRGIPASPGRVTATARVVRSLEDGEQLRQGDVLVAPVTTPAWTILFTRAAGVVTDTGGVGSHSSIVAREYGIPAVVGTTDATSRIRDGMLITVDGGAGIVTKVE
ncbi:MAG TPA: PEP/pyruvate-binding domain-containing protein [Candidatus Dormibacteraeota bacterium]|jgi:pyruvate,water dikinase|nr:PEP/pyruvate-binding domain-containing protein [Candidatus Dormibacteraeota bacterium]